jgi:hypothetical protein
MAVDHARSEISAGRVDDLRLRPDIFADIADRDDAIAVDGDVSQIDLFGNNIDQPAAANGHSRLGLPAGSGANEFSNVGHSDLPCRKGVFQLAFV